MISRVQAWRDDARCRGALPLRDPAGKDWRARAGSEGRLAQSKEQLFFTRGQDAQVRVSSLLLPERLGSRGQSWAHRELWTETRVALAGGGSPGPTVVWMVRFGAPLTFPRNDVRRKRAQSSRPPAVAPGERAPVLSSLAGDFVEYALAAESGQPLPVPCPRPQPQEQPKRSALDLLKWNAAALEVCLSPSPSSRAPPSRCS